MITNFKGTFLSNMYPVQVTVPWGTYTCAEAAFQAAKCVTEKDKNLFVNLNGYQAKSLGKKIALRPDWNDVRIDIMRQVVSSKFSDPTLVEKLLVTGEEELVEGNTWGDKIWGCVWDGKSWQGENNLGKILMEVRQAINNKEETIMKNVEIIINPETAKGVNHDVMVAMRGNNWNLPVVLEENCKSAKAAGVKIDMIKNAAGQQVISFGTFMRLQAWYAARAKSVNMNKILAGKQYIYCTSFQAAGLKKAAEAAGFTVKLDITGAAYFRDKYESVTADINANAFVAPKGISFIGAKKYTLRDGRVVDWYREGKHVSKILLPNKDTKFDVAANYFETKGAIVTGEELKAVAYLLVMADTRDEAIERVNAWASKEFGNGAHLYLGKDRLPVGYLNGEPCCQPLLHKDTNEKTAKNAMVVLRESNRTNNGEFLYADVQDISLAEDVPNVDNKIAAAIAAAIEPLKADIAILKEENITLKTELAALKAQMATAIVAESEDPKPVVEPDMPTETVKIRRSQKADNSYSLFEEPQVKEEPTVEEPKAVIPVVEEPEVSVKQDDIKQEDKDPEPPKPTVDDEEDEDDGYADLEELLKDLNPNDIQLVSACEEEPVKPAVPTNVEELTNDDVYTIGDFVRIPDVGLPGSYFEKADYDKAVAERNEKLQAAAVATKTLGVSFIEMKRMTMNLRCNGGREFYDIKAENDKVFVKTLPRNPWQKITVVFNGKKNVLKLEA